MGGAYPLRQCAVMDKEEQKHMDRVEEARRTLLALYGGSHSPLEESDPDFAAIKQRLVYGELYAQEALDPVMRELILLAVATTNQTMSEVKLHTCAALRSGAYPEAVKEAVYHCAPYIGLGKAEAAAAAVNEVLRTQGISLPLASQRTVSEEDRLTAGIAAQKSIFGPHIDEMRAAAPNDKKPLQDYLSAYCFGDFYTRSGLDIRQRELLTFSILSAQGGCENQIKAHAGGNAAVGNDKPLLLAALMLCMPYIGLPRTLNALSCVDQVLPEPPEGDRPSPQK